MDFADFLILAVCLLIMGAGFGIWVNSWRHMLARQTGNRWRSLPLIFCVGLSISGPIVAGAVSVLGPPEWTNYEPFTRVVASATTLSLHFIQEFVFGILLAAWHVVVWLVKTFVSEDVMPFPTNRVWPPIASTGMHYAPTWLQSTYEVVAYGYLLIATKFGLGRFKWP